MAKLIVALDLREEEAIDVSRRLMPEVTFFKVGLSLFAESGPAIVDRLKENGASVFLDLKLYDIPEQVEKTCRRLGELGIDMTTVHALGGKPMLEAAKRGLAEGAAASGHRLPMVIGVTILTSLDGRDLESIGLSGNIDREVGLLAGLARDAGLDGVVASARELNLVRDITGPNFKVITPGIRPPLAAANDQKRTTSPADAAARGADYLVVGRPITGAEDPKTEAVRILNDIS